MSTSETRTPKEETSMLSGIKRGWGARLVSTGKLATSAARLAARRVVGAEGKTDEFLGEALANEMDKMKGMAMKLGQIMSYFDGVLPKETHAAMRSLQQGTKSVEFGPMKEVLEEALGAPLAELFTHFAQTPVASASIGQVYRGNFAGQDVAIKIQYPGVRETIESDFSTLQRISKLVSLATSVDGPAIVESLRDRFGEECDYREEAKHQEAFATAFAELDACIIPAVIPARTCERVLTTQWCDGLDFYTFAEEATQAEKNEMAALLMRFAYHSFFTLGQINADPHPGNYLFPGNGQAIFLDFGCVVKFAPEFVEGERRIMQILMDNRKADFRDALMEAGVTPKPKKFDFDSHWEMMRYMAQPYTSSTFRFTREYVKGAMAFNGPSNPNLRHMFIPPQWIWYQRLQWGLHAVLAQLHAEGDFRSLLEDILAQPFTGMPDAKAPGETSA